MPDKSPEEPIEEVLARLYAFVLVVPELTPDVLDCLDLNQVTDEALLAIADAQAFLERVTRRSKL